ncbi:MAG: hypothetical protein IPF99_37825 [Deltaproteobacteria bacterium]|nr:hypothetical protein [Deltaproteobacteria bacterium]
MDRVGRRGTFRGGERAVADRGWKWRATVGCVLVAEGAGSRCAPTSVSCGLTLVVDEVESSRVLTERGRRGLGEGASGGAR